MIENNDENQTNLSLDPTVETIFKTERKTDITLPVKCGPNDIATFVMTSGSTGQPKAIIRQNKTILSIVESLEHKELCLLTPDDILLEIRFDSGMGQRNLFAVINAGAQLAIVRDDTDFEYLYNFIHKYNITTVFMAPTKLNYLVKNYEKYDKNYLKSLRDVTFGGAPMAESSFKFIANTYNLDKFRAGMYRIIGLFVS